MSTPVKVFVIGRPGSGKSTAVHRIIELAMKTGYSTKRLKEYEILLQMFLEDAEHKKFRPTEHGGFDVLDFSVLDTALEKLKRRVCELVDSTKKELLLIEFARDDYSKALNQLGYDFLQDAYFLFIDADIETCIQRIYKRITCMTRVDNHYVSEDIIRSYYSKDNKPYMAGTFKVKMGEQRVQVIENNVSLDEFIERIDRFATSFLTKEVGEALLV